MLTYRISQKFLCSQKCPPVLRCLLALTKLHCELRNANTHHTYLDSLLPYRKEESTCTLHSLPSLPTDRIHTFALINLSSPDQKKRQYKKQMCALHSFKLNPQKAERAPAQDQRH